ncbi:hypothetical protein BHE90_003933 [Fusarium euwallaceae]|uniref:LIM zinc-binding domain-containing protein n=1 Tax=Fusarium euwallaceae TaxID=1147111 RepID=A0A430M0M7_9HYPO|nr:hypothetical protein BHE90_003933 [Fusarium euwallaceae]
MDPLSIAASVVALTGTCLKTSKKLSDLAGNYEDVPVVIAMICSESTLISIALSELQMKILRRDDLSQAWASRTDVLMAFETALTGCMIVFSCLEAETRQLQSQNLFSMGVWAKIKFMWNQDRLKDLLNALRGQQTSIGFLLKILETDTLSDIQQTLRNNMSRIQAPASQAQSLRSTNPSIKLECESIFDNDTARLSLFSVEAASLVAPSELDFDFDDLVLNSLAYRRAFAKAHADSQPPQIHVVEGDLIDLSEAQSSIDNSDAETVRELNQDLQGLSMGADPETSTESTTLQQQPRRNSWDEQEDSFIPREIEPQQNPDVPYTYYDQASEQTPRSARTLPNCDKCKEHVGWQYVEELGVVWHPECFTCIDCDQVIGTHFYPHDDNGTQKPLCERDYFRRIELLCFKCHKSLEGSYQTALGRRYHDWHFSCDACDRVFNEEETYCEYKNKVLCLLDYLKLDSQRCQSCEFPILKEVVNTVDSEDGSALEWHPECYKIKEVFGTVLLASKKDREFLASVNEEVDGGSKEVRGWRAAEMSHRQEHHEAFITTLTNSTLQFLHVFRKTATTALEKRENPSEAFEHWIILTALTNLLFRLVAEVTDGMPSDKHMLRFINAFKKYAVEFLHTNPQTDSRCEALTVSVREILGAGMKSVMMDEDGNKRDKFITKLSATEPPELHLPYQNEPPDDNEQGMVCESCHKQIEEDAYTEVSRPGLRWHIGCWACIACKRPGTITPTPSRDTDGHFQCSSLKCGWGGIVTYIPNYSQAVYVMWRSWSLVTWKKSRPRKET